MCAFFSKLLNVPTEPKPTPFKDPIFLIGLMRSGTTLLMNTLSEHPQLLKAGFELNDIWSEIGGAPCSVNCAERTELDFQPKYANNMTAYFTKYIEESKSIKRHLARWSAKRYYGSGAIKYDWENLFLMNKSPHLSNKIRYLNKMYPNAKFIVIVRSPYGQIASLKMHLLQYHKNQNYYFELPEDGISCFTNHIKPSESVLKSKKLFPPNFDIIPNYWIRMNSMIFKHLEEVEEDRKCIISYEDLVQNQEESLGKVFEFLDLRRKYKKIESSIQTKNRKIHNTKTKGNPIEKWKSYLSQEEMKIIEESLKREKIKYDYICSNYKAE
jgi:hypothetical protein